MPNILDNIEKIRKLDKSNVLGSIDALADQARHAWEDASQVSVDINNIKNIVIAGMGGSGIGPDIIKHLFKDKLEVPLEVIHSYNLPNYANHETLVVLSSYSGNTEEVLSCAKQAEEKKCQVLAICAGGELAKLAKEKNIAHYLIDPKHNPSNQPRMAIGYSVFGILGLLNQAKLINVSEDEINDVISEIINISEKCHAKTKQEDNQAKLLAFEALQRRPILVASEFLQGAVHASVNQLNENAKVFADFKVVPEINHHLLEGLKFPDSNQDSHLFIFINSNLYLKRNQKRIKLTQQVVEQNNIETLVINLEASSKLTQIFELITLMAYTGLYLAALEGIDPSPITFVDWFKKELY
jgi:glucose/mannose-6-phosphate isomerase